MDNNASNSIRLFFWCMSVSVVILSLRVKIVYNINIISVKAIWNTFLFLLGIMPVFGIVAIFINEFKIYIQNKREKMFNFFDNVGDKIVGHGNGTILGLGMIGGIVTSMLIFEPTLNGIIKSGVAFLLAYTLMMLGIAGKKFAEKFGEDAYTWSKKKTLKMSGKKDKIEKKRA